MKQVMQSARSGKLLLKDVPETRVTSGCLLVENRASLISAGTERMTVEFAKKSIAGKARERPDLVRKVINKARRDGVGATMRSIMAKLDEPLPLGYSAAGEITEIGAGLEGRFRVGQRVAIAGAGFANHSEINSIPANLCAVIPDDVTDEEACFSTLAAVSMNGIRLLKLQLGDVMAVIGAGLVGQLASQFACLSGYRVVVLDYDKERLALARYSGAELTVDLSATDPIPAILDLSDGRGCDGVLIAAASKNSEPFDMAAKIARDRGHISLVGYTGTELDYRAFMKKELSVVVSRSYGPGRYDPDYETEFVKYPIGFVRWTETRNLEEAVRQMSRRTDKRLQVEQLITHRFPFSQVESAYELIVKNNEPHLGVVLKYDKARKTEKSQLRVPKSFPIVKQKPQRCVLGVFGAGKFARSILLPNLRKLNNVTFHTLVTQRGMSAGYFKDDLGFTYGETNADTVFENPHINAVIIATPHSSHANLTKKALRSGKSVFVEKPLATSREELNEIIAARLEGDAFLQVGFNRRFAPMALQARNSLKMAGGPKFLLIRVNAGPAEADGIDPEMSVDDSRILGEVCHFVDLASFLVGEEIRTVQATAITKKGACMDLTASLNFSEGSLATICYTSLGDSSYPKELIEGFAGGIVININDFRNGQKIYQGRKSRWNNLIQDKGHSGELKAFVNAVATGGAAPVEESDVVESSVATIAILEALRRGTAVTL